MDRAPLLHRMTAAGRGAWRTYAPESLRRSAQPLVRRILERRVEAALRSQGGEASPGPLVVSGLLAESKGVSEAARLSLNAFRLAGLHPISHDLRPMLDRGLTTGVGLPADQAGGVWFLHVNAPEAVQALGRLDPVSWRGRYRIGYWAYELPRVPAEWVRASAAFHEIWAPSSFVVDALRSSGVETPVRLMPHPVALGAPPAAPERAGFEIPGYAFAVLTLADLRSSAARKNLLGAISIYMQAFPAPSTADPPACLIVKVREDKAYPAFLAQARHAARGRADIRFLTGDLSSGDMHRLIASCSLVLSPHRAEGFGLSLAEALLAGVPILATGWSGNVDFMAGLPELTIDYSLVPVRDAYGVYRARRQKWAEPDMQNAVAKLRVLAASPDLRARLAAKGRGMIKALSAPWSREALLAMPFGSLIASAGSEPAVSPVAAAGPSR